MATTTRLSHTPPAPLNLTKQKSNRSLRALFGGRNAAPVSPPSSPGSLSPSIKSPKVIAFSFSSYLQPAVPQEVLACIARQLRELHRHGAVGTTCDTCYMRDLASLALVSKKWWRGTSRALYSKIHISGPDSQNNKFRFGNKPSLNYGSRINLLCRTLRSRPDLAEMVSELKLPAYDILQHPSDIATIHSIVAGLVMCCPNLERLLGFYPTYEFGMGLETTGNPKEDEWRRGSDRLWQALSTRKRLKEHVWMVVGDQFDPSPDDIGYVDDEGVFHHETAPLPQPYIRRFLSYHAQWTNLETLVLHGMNTISSLSPTDFESLFRHVPNLMSLYVSHFAYYQFNGDVLSSLPRNLTSLRLECLPGLSDKCLSNYFASHSHSLQKLSLINLEIQSLLLIIKMFANLSKLQKFTLLQKASPEIDMTDTLFLRPLLASRSLRYLHWDCLTPGTAETHISTSILEGGFPSLSRIRAPCDTQGILQSICRPREKIELPGDKFRSLIVRQTPQKTKQAANNYAPASPEIVNSSRPTQHLRTASSSHIAADSDQVIRHLPTARTKAQKRLEQAQNPGSMNPRYHQPSIPTPGGVTNSPSFSIRIVISNHDLPRGSSGSKEIIHYHGFLGTIGSKVDYHLLPDIPGSESALAGLGDIIEAGWEWREPGSSSEGCTGLSNVRNAVEKNSGASGKAMVKYWSHRERLPWKMIPLDVLF